MYIYPDNLKAKPMLLLWQLKDLTVIGTAFLISVLSLSTIGFMLPLLGTAVFAFLTIRFSDTSILDYMKSAICFFVLKQQYYEWRLDCK